MDAQPYAKVSAFTHAPLVGARMYSARRTKIWVISVIIALMQPRVIMPENIKMDNTTTWHDQKPSHPPVPKAVVVANEHAIIARQVYDDYIERMLNNGIPGVDWTETDYLAKRANDAEDRAEQARHDALNPCTCKPDGDACPVCVADNKERYGDSGIPWDGE